MAIDVGSSTRNAITIMNKYEQILYREEYPYKSKYGKGHHRRELAKHIRELVQEYSVQRILVERVCLFRGNNVSKLTNIEGLSRLIATITDYTYDLCEIYDVAVKSWKSQVLNNTSADKIYSLNYVKLIYKLDDISHDQADSICQAIYGIRNWMRMKKKQNITDR